MPNKKAMTKLLERPEVVSWRALMNAFQAIYGKLEDALQKEGCSYSRFQLLFFLYFEGSMAPVDLSRKMLVTRSNMSMFLQRMLKDSLVTECPESTSAKRPCYMLTKKGIAFFESIFPAHIARIVKTIPAFSPSQIKHLKKLGTSVLSR